jgi:hypothetical protein
VRRGGSSLRVPTLLPMGRPVPPVRAPLDVPLGAARHKQQPFMLMYRRGVLGPSSDGAGEIGFSDTPGSS